METSILSSCLIINLIRSREHLDRIPFHSVMNSSELGVEGNFNAPFRIHWFQNLLFKALRVPPYLVFFEDCFQLIKKWNAIGFLRYRDWIFDVNLQYLLMKIHLTNSVNVYFTQNSWSKVSGACVCIYYIWWALNFCFLLLKWWLDEALCGRNCNICMQVCKCPAAPVTPAHICSV